MRGAALLVAAAVGVAGLAVLAAAARAPRNRLRAVGRREGGWQAYKTLGCGSCHGDHREGKRSGPVLAGLADHWTRPSLTTYLKDPPAMIKTTPRLAYKAEQYRSRCRPTATRADEATLPPSPPTCSRTEGHTMSHRVVLIPATASARRSRTPSFACSTPPARHRVGDPPRWRGDPLEPRRHPAEATLEAVRSAGVALKGPITTPLERALRRSTSDCARPSTSTPTSARSNPCPTSRPATATSTWSSCARTPRASTRHRARGDSGVVESLKIMTRTACLRICRLPSSMRSGEAAPR